MASSSPASSRARRTPSSVSLAGTACTPWCVQPRGELVFIECAGRRRRDDDERLGERERAAQHLLPVLVAKHPCEEDEFFVAVERGERIHQRVDALGIVRAVNVKSGPRRRSSSRPGHWAWESPSSMASSVSLSQPRERSALHTSMTVSAFKS